MLSKCLIGSRRNRVSFYKAKGEAGVSPKTVAAGDGVVVKGNHARHPFRKGETGKPKLLDEVRRVLRLKHYSIRTEKTYLDWIRRYMVHHRLRHSRDMGAPEVTTFLSHLAVDLNVSASTQNQALAALLFLYQEVLGVELPWLGEVERAKRPSRLPVVLTQEEAKRVVEMPDREQAKPGFVLQSERGSRSFA